MQCEIINFPKGGSHNAASCEVDYEGLPEALSDEDILNLLIGVVNLIKKYATFTQLEFLLDRLEDIREELLQDFI